mmetsp:Transcript_64147/g.126743  ORF Transcript_64147/g.126743 Transcript_64147/m.126743 type:complete len:227 (-) Transcript_64147:522-1202(-)
MVGHATPLRLGDILEHFLGRQLEDVALLVFGVREVVKCPRHRAVGDVEVVAMDLDCVRLADVGLSARLPIGVRDDDVLGEAILVPVALRWKLDCIHLRAELGHARGARHDAACHEEHGPAAETLEHRPSCERPHCLPKLRQRGLHVESFSALLAILVAIDEIVETLVVTRELVLELKLAAHRADRALHIHADRAAFVIWPHLRRIVRTKAQRLGVVDQNERRRRLE